MTTSSTSEIVPFCHCYECSIMPKGFSTWEDSFDSQPIIGRKRVSPWLTPPELENTVDGQTFACGEMKSSVDGHQIQPARKRNSGYAKIYSRYYNQPSDQLPPSIRRTSPIAAQPVTQPHRRERVQRYKRPIDRPPSTWFFEHVASNPRRTYIEGEEHFKCLWPSVKRTETIQTVTRSMRGSLSGLVRHLESHVPHVYAFYKELEERHRRKFPPRQMDYEIASRKRDWDDPDVMRYLEGEYGLMTESESGSESHYDSEPESELELEPEPEETRPKFSYAHWEELIIKWFLVTNKSFDHVEQPEFVDLMKFLRQGDPDFASNMPTAASLARRYSLMRTRKEQEQMDP